MCHPETLESRHAEGCKFSFFGVYSVLVLHMWHLKWKETPSQDLPVIAAKTLKQIDSVFFQNIYWLVPDMCTLSVTSCECERSISGLGA